MPELLLALVLMFQLNPGPAGMVTGQVLKAGAADGAVLPSGTKLTAIWVPISGGTPVITQGTAGGTPVNLPFVTQYYLSISDIPDGFKIKSVAANGMELAAPANFQNIPTGPASILILLSRN
jgi:hypothetical protein